MSMNAETKAKVVRFTTGLRPELYTDISLVEMMDWTACYTELFKMFHPGGLFCSCGSDDMRGHGRSKTGYPVYRCMDCGYHYSMLSGTVFSGCTLDARRLLLFMRLWGDGRTAEDMAAALGLHRNSVLQLMTKVKMYRKHRSN